VTKKSNRDQMLKLRVTPEERERLETLASDAGMSLSEYMRRRGLMKSIKRNKGFR